MPFPNRLTVCFCSLFLLNGTPAITAPLLAAMRPSSPFYSTQPAEIGSPGVAQTGCQSDDQTLENDSGTNSATEQNTKQATANGRVVVPDAPGPSGQDANAQTVAAGDTVLSLPEKWIIQVPPARQVCLPTRNALADASRTVSKAPGRVFRHEPNGGWHRKAQGLVHGKPVLHVGMDFGLWRVGEPVFAIANGIVRLSAGPVNPKRKSGSRAARSGQQKSDPTKFNVSAGCMPWGNIIVIEHHFPNEGYFTSVYGHLGTNRLVETGEAVQAGQMIGRIGAKNPYINGGYIPHLHFGIRKGRMGEENGILSVVPVDGKFYAMRMTSISADKVVVELDRDNPISPPAGIVAPENAPPVRERQEYPARLMWTMNRFGFHIVGHTDDARPWLNPLAFLRSRGVLTNPARFRTATRRKKK